MENKTTSLPSNLEIKNHSINALSQYWQKKNSFISELPVDRKNVNIVPGTPLKLKSVVLPDWADNIGINKALLVPIEAIPVNYKGNESDLWQHVDWFLAIFLLLECWHERLWEDKFESIHSYSFRLKGWDDRAWDYAWVNRIGLFLMEWSAHINNKSSESIFGKLPSSNIKMTHDVDAIKKTWAIRIKQSIFIFFNGCRAFLNGHFIIAFKKFFKCLKCFS